MRRRKTAKQSGTKIDVSRLKTVIYLSGENGKNTKYFTCFRN